MAGGSDLWGSLARKGGQLYGTTIWYPAAVILRVFEFILSLAVLGVMARFIDVYNLSGKWPGVGYYLWIPLGASIASILQCMTFVPFTVENVHWVIIACFCAVDTGLFITYVYSSVTFLKQIAAISCGHSADHRILNGWSTELHLTQSFKPDIQALTKTTVAHCVEIKAASYLMVALALFYLFSTGFSIGLFWKKFDRRSAMGGKGRQHPDDEYAQQYYGGRR